MPAKYIDSCNRVVSILHSLFCLFGALIYFATDNNVRIKCGGEVTNFEYFMIIVSTGYFFYDVLCMIYLGLLDSDGSFHHGAVIVITCCLVCYDQGCNYWVGVLLMSECSIPFMHCRLILRSLGLSRTKAFNFFEDMYFSLYFLGRVVIASALIWQIMACEHIHIFLKIGGFPLEIRSIYFIWQMYRVYKNRKLIDSDLKKNNIEL